MGLGPNTEIGPYRIDHLLGAGEMGEVYKAHDPRLGRDVALKILPDRIANNPDMVARFEREVRAVAALSHPNVLGIYDVGRSADYIYAVMELVPGVTLREKLAGPPLSHAAVQAIALQIARGLAAAHARQIVHRDLKPDNVLVRDDGHVKILDFGIAKIDPAGLGGDHPTLYNTMPGVVMGTLAYMAPEQVRGLPVDARADIFSFGAILFEMLAGQPPFARRSSAETIAALVDPEPADPVAIAAMPAPMARVVAACLAKPIAERMAAIGDAIALLEPDGHGADLERTFAALARTAAIPAAAAARRGGRSIAVLPFADMSPAHDQDYFCEGMADEIISSLARVAGLRVVARTSAFRFKGRTDDIRDIARALNVDTVLEGSVRTAGNRMRVTAQLINADDGYQLWSERFDRDTTDVFAVQDDIARTVSRVLTDTLAGAYRTLELSSRPANFDAYTAYLKGRQQWSRRTEHGLSQSVDLFREALAVDDAYAPAWAGLADSYVTLGIYGVRPPAEVMPLARDAGKRALAASPHQASAYASMACVDALYDWAWDRADAGFARAVELDPNLASAYQWRAMHHLLPLGKFAAAQSALTRAHELDPVSPAIAASRGLAASFAGDAPRALRELELALARDPDSPLLHFFHGVALGTAGDAERALGEFDAAAQLGDRRPELIAAVGYTRARLGDRAAAETALVELAALARDRYVSPVAMAQVHAGLGDAARALDALDAAAEARAADLVWLNVRPTFATLRQEPRFAALAQRLGLSSA